MSKPSEVLKLVLFILHNTHCKRKKADQNVLAKGQSALIQRHQQKSKNLWVSEHDNTKRSLFFFSSRTFVKVEN